MSAPCKKPESDYTQNVLFLVLESVKASQMASQIEQKKSETGSSELWMLNWVLKVHAMQGAGQPLPMPYELQYFAPITQVFPLTSSPAQLYRYN